MRCILVLCSVLALCGCAVSYGIVDYLESTLALIDGVGREVISPDTTVHQKPPPRIRTYLLEIVNSSDVRVGVHRAGFPDERILLEPFDTYVFVDTVLWWQESLTERFVFTILFPQALEGGEVLEYEPTDVWTQEVTLRPTPIGVWPAETGVVKIDHCFAETGNPCG